MRLRVYITAVMALLALARVPALAAGDPLGGMGACSSGVVTDYIGAPTTAQTYTVPDGTCAVMFDSGTTSDVITSIAITLPHAGTVPSGVLRFFTNRAITTVTFAQPTSGAGSGQSIYGAATPLSNTAAYTGFNVLMPIGNLNAYINLAKHNVPSGGGGSGGGGGGTTTTSASFTIASGAGTGIGAVQAGRVANVRGLQAINVQTWFNDASTTDQNGVANNQLPAGNPSSRQGNCAYYYGGTNSACNSSTNGCTSRNDGVCWPHQYAGFIYAINFIGIKHIRNTATPDRNLDICANVPGLTIAYTMVFPTVGSFPSLATQQTQMNEIGASCLESAEGPNEPDNYSNLPSSYGGGSDPFGMVRQFSTDIVNSVASAGFTLPTFGPSITPYCNSNGGQYTCYPSYSNLYSSGLSYENMHDYMATDYIERSGDSGGDFFTENKAQEANAYSPTIAAVVTESGLPQTPYGAYWGCCLNGGTDEATAAKLIGGSLFTAWKDGIKRIYWYQIASTYYDTVSGDSDVESHFGWFDNSWNPKKTATYFHNLNTVLSDTGATALTFATGTVSFTTTGKPASTDVYSFEASNGHYFLVLNSHPTGLWTYAGTVGSIGHSNTISPTSMTVNFGASFPHVYSYDPYNDATCGTTCTPDTTAAAASSITLSVSDHIQVIELSPT